MDAAPQSPAPSPLLPAAPWEHKGLFHKESQQLGLCQGWCAPRGGLALLSPPSHGGSTDVSPAQGLPPAPTHPHSEPSFTHPARLSPQPLPISAHSHNCSSGLLLVRRQQSKVPLPWERSSTQPDPSCPGDLQMLLTLPLAIQPFLHAASPGLCPSFAPTSCQHPLPARYPLPCPLQRDNLSAPGPSPESRFLIPWLQGKHPGPRTPEH